jgi:hypothetical protein
MKKALILAILLVLSTLTVSATVKQSCGSGEKAVLELYSNQDAHVYETGAGADFKLCVSDEFDATVADRGSAPSDYTAVLDVSSFYSDTQYGGHVGLPGEYPTAEKQLFLKHSSKEIQGASTSCNGDCQFLVSLFSSANSHAAERDYFPSNVYVNLRSVGDPSTDLSLTHGSSGSDTTVEASFSASADEGSSISSCTIDWGDGSSDSVSNSGSASHNYGSSGSYTATYSCEDADGRTSASSDSIEVPSEGSGGVLVCSGGDVVNQTSGNTQQACGSTSSWSSCNYQSTCDEDGSQSRVVRGCSSGSCYSNSETRTCTRDTDGRSCPAGSGRSCNTGSCVDTTPPDTSDSSDSNWHSTSQYINLNCDDSTSSGNGGSGCSTTYYCLGQGCSPSSTGTGVSISDEGVNHLRYYSTDQSSYSSSEDVQSTTVKIDYTRPETNDNSDNNWHKTAQDVTMSCNDPDNPQGSGCDTIYYCVDQSGSCSPRNDGGAASGNSRTHTVSNEGVNYLRYRSVDNAGNLEQVRSTEVKIDYTPPNVAIKESLTEDKSRRATVTCSDRYSGCDSDSREIKLYTPESFSANCPTETEEYGIKNSSKKLSKVSYVCGAVEDNVGHRSVTERPVEIESGTISTRFEYRSAVMKTIPDQETTLLYSIQNLKDSYREINVKVEGPEADFYDGDTSMNLTLGPEAEELLRISVTPTTEDDRLRAVVTDRGTGMSVSDTMEIQTRPARFGKREAPGLGVIHLAVIVLTAATAYYIRQ